MAVRTAAKPEPAPSAEPKTETAKSEQSAETSAPSAPTTIPQSLCDRGVAAIRKLGNHAADSESELLAFRRNLVRAKRADMVKAVDDLLEYNRAAKGLEPREMRDSRTVGEATPSSRRSRSASGGSSPA